MGLAHEKKSYLQEKANFFEIGSQIKDLIPAEAQKIAQEYALEHFPEMFRTHTACGMKPERIHDEYNSADYQECKKIHNAIFY